MKMYAIVECEEHDKAGLLELSVSVVPTSWIYGENCFWPNFSAAKLKTAVKRREPPAFDSWTPYRSRVIKTFGW